MKLSIAIPAAGAVAILLLLLATGRWPAALVWTVAVVAVASVAARRSARAASPERIITVPDPAAGGFNGRSGGGDSGGGPYPDPYLGIEPEAGGYMGHGGQSDMNYHGTGQLGRDVIGPNANAPTSGAEAAPLRPDEAGLEEAGDPLKPRS